jgi:hypothetical protein
VVIFSLTLRKFKPLTANPATIATMRLIRINMVPLSIDFSLNQKLNINKAGVNPSSVKGLTKASIHAKRLKCGASAPLWIASTRTNLPLIQTNSPVRKALQAHSIT